jgi:hypothetical protein
MKGLRHHWISLSICYLLAASREATEPWVQTQSKNSDLTLCELVENAAKFNGQRVTVYAYYSYSFEISWMFCWECKGKGQTWLEIPIDEDAGGSRLHKELAKLRKDMGSSAADLPESFMLAVGPMATWERIETSSTSRTFLKQKS